MQAPLETHRTEHVMIHLHVLAHAISVQEKYTSVMHAVYHHRYFQ